MTSHTLAKLLLANPEMPIAFLDTKQVAHPDITAVDRHVARSGGQYLVLSNVPGKQIDGATYCDTLAPQPRNR